MAITCDHCDKKIPNKRHITILVDMIGITSNKQSQYKVIVHYKEDTIDLCRNCLCDAIKIGPLIKKYNTQKLFKCLYTTMCDHCGKEIPNEGRITILVNKKDVTWNKQRQYKVTVRHKEDTIDLCENCLCDAIKVKQLMIQRKPYALLGLINHYSKNREELINFVPFRKDDISLIPTDKLTELRKLINKHEEYELLDLLNPEKWEHYKMK